MNKNEDLPCGMRQSRYASAQQHMNTAMKGLVGTTKGNIAAACMAAIAIGAVATPQKAQAVYNYTYGADFIPNFDSLTPTGTSMAVLNQTESTGGSDWFGTAGLGRTTSIMVGNGASTEDGFYNYGATGGTDRALGMQGAGFFLGFELFNQTQALDKFSIDLTFEIWRRNLESAGSFRLDYQISATPLAGLNSGTWRNFANFAVDPGAPAANPNLPISEQAFSTTIVDSGPLGATPFNWAPNTYLYIRLFNTSQDEDTAIALDNLAFQAVPEPSTWVAAGLLLGFAGYTQFRRRKVNAPQVAAA